MADFYLDSAAIGANNGTTKVDAWTTLATALATVTAADRLFVSKTHLENPAVSTVYNFPTTWGLQVLCIDFADDSISTGAIIGPTGGNFSLTVARYAYIYGVRFRCGSGSVAAINLGTTGASNTTGLVLDSCYLDEASTHANSLISFGSSTGSAARVARVRLIDCTISFGATTGTLQLRYTQLCIRNLTLAGSAPTSLFAGGDVFCFIVDVARSDLTGTSWTNLYAYSGTEGNVGVLLVRDCKLPAGIAITTGTPNHAAPLILLQNSDSADTNYRIAEQPSEGSTVQETTLVVGSDTYSRKMAAGSLATFPSPLQSAAISRRNTTVGSAITVTVEILRDNVANLQNDEVWLEVEYLGTSGFPRGSLASDRAASILATPADQDASTASWTTTGMANPNKQKLVVTFIPQEAGFLVARVMLATTTTIYYRPVLQVT